MGTFPAAWSSFGRVQRLVLGFSWVPRHYRERGEKKVGEEGEGGRDQNGDRCKGVDQEEEEGEGWGRHSHNADQAGMCRH